MEKIGLTTTVPVEIIYASGRIPVDLNNVFISHPEPGRLVEDAEINGYPRNVCGWIKGLYSTALETEEIKTVIAVTQGDCSNTQALMETLQERGIRIIPFAFPFDRDPDLLRLQMEKLMDCFGVGWPEVKAMKAELDRIRKKVREIDTLTWKENRVGGFDNHLYQVSCSDFNGDYLRFEREVDDFLARARVKEPYQESVRLGYIGVPPIMPELYDYLEERGARVVFNEVQRQFAMPNAVDDLVEQYRLYTYPYDVFGRVQDIAAAVAERQIAGIIHYTQSFCFRQIQDLILRDRIKVPFLTLEGDKPHQLDARSRMRIDAFVEMLR